MSAADRTEEEQRKILLTTSGWIPLDGALIGEGGGARVFKVVSHTLVNRLEEPLRTPWNDRERAKKHATEVANLLADIVDGKEPAVAAGKVAKRVDPRIGREIEILRDVQHPNLIRMLDYDRSEKPSWYVMPVMAGVLKGDKRFTGNLPAVVRGMADVARALAALHSHAKPIVHRDIKPGNIFVTKKDGWILGDPGVAYRDETTTRPVSKDWAPTWYGHELAQTPKADLYMLGKTALSVLVGGDKPLDPSHVKKPKFNLPELYPTAPGVRELYDLICTLIVTDPDEMPFDDARALVPALEKLVPTVENSGEWRLAQEIEALKRVVRSPQLVLSFISTRDNFVGGDYEGLRQVMVQLPAYCSRLVFWPRGHHSHHWGARLHNDAGTVVLAETNDLQSGVPAAMEVPTEARGNVVRLTITNQSGMLHSLMVYAEP